MAWEAEPCGRRGRQKAKGDAAIQACLTIPLRGFLEECSHELEFPLCACACTINPLMELGAPLPHKASKVELYLAKFQAVHHALRTRVSRWRCVAIPDGKTHPASQVFTRQSGFLNKPGLELRLGRENLIVTA